MKIINFLSQVAIYMAMVVVVAMMLLTVADVFMRYAFSRPITGTTEITEYMMLCLLLGMAPCALEKRHVKVDVVMERLMPGVQATVDIITFVAGLGLVAILTWQGFEAGLYALSYDVRSSMLKVPNFPFYLVLVLSFAILCLAMVILLIQRVAELMKR